MQRQVDACSAGCARSGSRNWLREAVENLVAFWRRRRPEIRYEVAISAESEDLADVVGTAICRVVQEALSNAVRHAEPNRVAVSIKRDHDLEQDATRSGSRSSMTARECATRTNWVTASLA